MPVDQCQWQAAGSLRFARFPALTAFPWLTAVFTGRHGGVSPAPFGGEPGGLNLSYSVGDRPDRVQENRRRAVAVVRGQLDRTVVGGLVHGTRVATVAAVPPQRCEGAAPGDQAGLAAGYDVLITATPDLALLVTCADCTPLYLVDPDHQAIGLAHAGWRGTAGDIAGATVRALAEQFGSDPARLQAVVGPSIGPCCYEVDAPVVAALERYPGSEHWLRPGVRPRHWQLDLWQANRDLLVAAGVPAQQVAVAGVCTACAVDRCFSHRAEQGCTGRQAAIARIVPDAARTAGTTGVTS